MSEVITDALAKRASDLKLHGLLAHWDEIDPHSSWVKPLIDVNSHANQAIRFSG